MFASNLHLPLQPQKLLFLGGRGYGFKLLCFWLENEILFLNIPPSRINCCMTLKVNSCSEAPCLFRSLCSFMNYFFFFSPFLPALHFCGYLIKSLCYKVTLSPSLIFFLHKTCSSSIFFFSNNMFPVSLTLPVTGKKNVIWIFHIFFFWVFPLYFPISLFFCAFESEYGTSRGAWQ